MYKHLTAMNKEAPTEDEINVLMARWSNKEGNNEVDDTDFEVPAQASDVSEDDVDIYHREQVKRRS